MRTDLALVPERFVIPQAYGTDTEPRGPAFEGCWSGERIKGWAVAYFTHAQASIVLAASLAVMAHEPFYRARYAAESDAFVFNDGLNRLEIYEGAWYEFAGAAVRLYNLGGRGTWIWQTASQYAGRQ